MWLSGCLYIEGRLNDGPQLQRKYKDGTEAKQCLIISSAQRTTSTSKKNNHVVMLPATKIKQNSMLPVTSWRSACRTNEKSNSAGTEGNQEDIQGEAK